MVSKKYGPSTERNLFKRRVRYLYNSLFLNKNLTTIVRPTKSNYNYKQLNGAFAVFFDNLYN